MSVTHAPSQTGTRSANILTRHPLVAFFALAYALSWLAWSPWVLSLDGIGLLPYHFAAYAGLCNIAALALGPTGAALIMTWVLDGPDGIKRLLKRIVQWRVGVRWYLIVLLGLPIVMLISTLLIPGAIQSFQPAAIPGLLAYTSFFALVFFLGGPFFEEIGWRGFALPRLQQLYGALGGSLILGLMWSLWHLPLFFVPAWDTPKGSVLDVVWFTLAATGNAILFTWILNSTRGSLLMAMLGHASLNAFTVYMFQIFPAPAVTESLMGYAVVFSVIAVVLVGVTRGTLGYVRATEPPLGVGGAPATTPAPL